MPEGDTIRRIADHLAPQLVGKRIERATTQGLARAIAGATVTAVASHGKHLMIDLDSGTQVRVHLGMYGRFRAYGRAEGEQIVARMSPGRATLVIVVPDAVFVWTARTVEISDRRAPRRGMALQALGPDVLAADFAPEIAAARAAAQRARTISEVLLDQRVAAGIGNIWRCEALHACRVDPRAQVGSLPLATLVALYREARERMQRRAPHAVYSRAGERCSQCQPPDVGIIEAFRMGDPPRWTWWCPCCQAHGGGTGVRG
jgi:endonuclease-8